MRKLEKAPNWSEEKLYNKAIKIRNEFDLTDLIQKINDDYLYWDKVKYKKTTDGIEPQIIWAITKLSRILSAKNIKFGNTTFKYNVTDNIQKGLHEFDLNFGGNLSSETILNEEDKIRQAGWLSLSATVAQQLELIFDLLGLQVPTKM